MAARIEPDRIPPATLRRALPARRGPVTPESRTGRRGPFVGNRQNEIDRFGRRE
ncbi:hypothetical protein LG3211_4561 [Lysobacter gummosus]|nr:hypothetical protein LG3211_4561 [Lysobacter gummosus]